MGVGLDSTEAYAILLAPATCLSLSIPKWGWCPRSMGRSECTYPSIPPEVCGGRFVATLMGSPARPAALGRDGIGAQWHRGSHQEACDEHFREQSFSLHDYPHYS